MTVCPLTLTDSHIMVGNGSNQAADVAMSGDVTIDNTGATTIKDNVALGGSPTTTTQAPGDNSTKVATTAYTDGAVAAHAGWNATKTLASDYTSHSSTHTDGTQDDLFSYTVPANTLTKNGAKLVITFGGNMTPRTNSTQEILINVGPTPFLFNDFEVINTTPTLDTDGTFRSVLEVVRTGATGGAACGQVVCATALGDAQATAANSFTLDWSSTCDIAFGAIANGAGAASGDITLRFATIDVVLPP